MKYNWKKALASAASIFLGVVLAKVGTGIDVPMTWVFWKHTLLFATVTTVTAEARYVYAWLASIGGGTQ